MFKHKSVVATEFDSILIYPPGNNPVIPPYWNTKNFYPHYTASLAWPDPLSQGAYRLEIISAL